MAPAALTLSYMVFSGIYNALMATKKKPAISVLLGLIPLVQYYMSIYLVYTYSDWAWQNTGYVILMLTPVITLISCRQIVCNVTPQDSKIGSFNTFWYLLFPANRMLPPSERFDEAKVAIVVTVITSFWFFHWVFGTIGQICEACDIWCLSIKPERLKRKNKSK